MIPWQPNLSGPLMSTRFGGMVTETKVMQTNLLRFLGHKRHQQARVLVEYIGLDLSSQVQTVETFEYGSVLGVHTWAISQCWWQDIQQYLVDRVVIRSTVALADSQPCLPFCFSPSLLFQDGKPRWLLWGHCRLCRSSPWFTNRHTWWWTCIRCSDHGNGSQLIGTAPVVLIAEDGRQ